MTTGTFTTSLGDVTVSIHAGTGTCNIVSLGTINYNFDVTPDQVTIDRVQALYNTVNIGLFQYNDAGVDLYETIKTQAVSGTVRVDLSVLTHELETFEFKFMVGINDVTYNEQTKEIMLKCQMFLDSTVTNGDVFTDLVTDNETYQFTKRDTLSTPRNYVCAVPETFITKAMKGCFGNNFDTVYESGDSGLPTGRYSSKIFASDPVEPTDAVSGTTEQFVLVNMTGNEFISIDEKSPVISLGTGTINYLSFSNYTAQGDFRSDNAPEPTINGNGTIFETEVSIGNRIYARVNEVSVYVGVVKSIDGNNQLTLQEWPGTAIPAGGWVQFEIHSFRTPDQVSVIDTVKDLAGAEGAIFGTGFSKNFYINRLLIDETVQIPYENVTDLKSSPFYFSLGTSILRQSASFQRTGAKEFGRYESRLRSENIIDYSRQMPNLIDTTSVARPQPNAVKELKIEYAPAYPILNKARYTKLQDGNTVFFNGDYENFDRDRSLEQSLTSLGLRSYIRALTNKGDDIVVEFTVTGAFRIKPYQTFTFSTDAPESVVGRKFRPTELHYDIINDTLKCKAYQVDVTDEVVQSSDGSPTQLGVVSDDLNFGTVATNGGSNLKVFQVNAQSLVNPVNVFTNNPELLLSTDGDNYAPNIEISPDGLGNVQVRVFALYRPLQRGVLDTRIVVRTYITPTTRITRRLVARGFAVQGGGGAGDWGIVPLNYDGGTFDSISVNLFSAVKKGTELEIVDSLTGRVTVVTVREDAPAGVGILLIEAQVLELYENSVIRGSTAYQGTGIYVAENQIVLKVNSDGKVAQIALGVEDAVGSVIDISADQVKINDIIFTQGVGTDPGRIASDPYTPGVEGWKIDGDGSAEFNDVTVRGGIVATSLQLDIADELVTFQNDSGNLRLFGDGLDFEIALNDSTFRIVNSQVDFTGATVFDASIINITSTTDSTSTTTGSIITAGGVGIAKNLNVGGAKINFANLPTSDSGLAVGDLWRDGNTVKVKT